MSTCVICHDEFIRGGGWSQREPCECGAMVTWGDVRDMGPERYDELQRSWAEQQRVPLGCVQCAHCDRVSDVYEVWPTCESCSQETCPRCAAPDATHEIDYDVGEGDDMRAVASLVTTCRSCAIEDDPMLTAIREAATCAQASVYRPALRVALSLLRQRVRAAREIEVYRRIRESIASPSSSTSFADDFTSRLRGPGHWTGD